MTDAPYDLIILESPGKVAKVRDYAGNGYRVLATAGHVRDLAPDRLAVDVDDAFQETYTTTQPKAVKRIKKAAREARTIYLATDPDREGEAIAWHVVELLPQRDQKKVKRITFREITPEAIQEALAHPHTLNVDLVDARRARRIVDRLMGYTISPLLPQWGIASNRPLSAGRVQTVALRLLVERENARRDFTPTTYYTLHVNLQHPSSMCFWAKLIEPPRFATTRDRDDALARLASAAWWVAGSEETSREKKPPKPFTTSAIQQAASRTLKFTPGHTQTCAQQLYEAGLVTYIRTDGVAVASDAQQAARAVIEELFTPNHLPPTPPTYRARKGAQEAHEAIRPTRPALYPKTLRDDPGGLSNDALALYELIWRRFLASQMTPARYTTTVITIQAGRDPTTPLPYTFIATSHRPEFQGFLSVYDDKADDEANGAPEPDDVSSKPDDAANFYLPKTREKAPLGLGPNGLRSRDRTTKPPPRYTQARLIAALERRQIGRPSTYAAAVEVLLERAYAAMDDRHIIPTPLGEKVLAQLLKHFPTLFSYEFTAGMEALYDAIASGETSRERVLSAFWMGELRPTLRVVLDTLGLEGACPDCGGELIIRQGRSGAFVGCRRYPECTYTRDLVETKEEEPLCAT